MACASGHWRLTRSLKTHSSSYIFPSSKSTGMLLSNPASKICLVLQVISHRSRMSKANFLELCWVSPGVVLTEIYVWVPLCMKNHMESSQEMFFYLTVGSLLLFLLRADKSPHFFLAAMSTILNTLFLHHKIQHRGSYGSVHIVRVIQLCCNQCSNTDLLPSIPCSSDTWSWWFRVLHDLINLY